MSLSLAAAAWSHPYYSASPRRMRARALVSIGSCVRLASTGRSAHSTVDDFIEDSEARAGRPACD